MNHRDEAGTIATGQVADLVVLDRDITAGPLDEVRTATVQATYVGGVAVYER